MLARNRKASHVLTAAVGRPSTRSCRSRSYALRRRLESRRRLLPRGESLSALENGSEVCRDQSKNMESAGGSLPGSVYYSHRDWKCLQFASKAALASLDTLGVKIEPLRPAWVAGQRECSLTTLTTGSFVFSTHAGEKAREKGRGHGSIISRQVPMMVDNDCT